MNILKTLQSIENNELLKTFKELYGTDESQLEYQRQRYLSAVNNFAKLYPKRKNIRIFSAPGRTEIGGNHTDHQNGCVLAAAVNLDVIAVVAFHQNGVIRIKSEGYEPFTVKLSDVSTQSGKTGTAAIVCGIAAKFMDMGVEIGGFDLYCTSDVLCGSGISSSAAFKPLSVQSSTPIITIIRQEQLKSQKSDSLPKMFISARTAVLWTRWFLLWEAWCSSTFQIRSSQRLKASAVILRNTATACALPIQRAVTLTLLMIIPQSEMRWRILQSISASPI